MKPNKKIEQEELENDWQRASFYISGCILNPSIPKTHKFFSNKIEDGIMWECECGLKIKVYN